MTNPFQTAWIYNSNTGTVLVGDPLSMTVVLKTGNAWHGLFHSTDEVNRYYNENKTAHPEWKAPTGNPITQGQNTIDAAQSKAADALGTFKGINLEVWILRIAEVVLGIVLIGVGLAKLTGVSNVVSQAAKVAIP